MQNVYFLDNCGPKVGQSVTSTVPVATPLSIFMIYNITGYGGCLQYLATVGYLHVTRCGSSDELVLSMYGLYVKGWFDGKMIDNCEDFF
jgi:hypothetical protein